MNNFYNIPQQKRSNLSNPPVMENFIGSRRSTLTPMSILNDNSINYKPHHHDIELKPNNQYTNSCNMYSKPRLLHNNIQDEVADEETFEYPIIFDSVDRDSNSFKNPFVYKVSLNPTPQTRKPTIDYSFSNIRYIKLELAQLPRFYQLDKFDESQSGPIFNVINDKINPMVTSNSQINEFIGSSEMVGSVKVSYVNITYVRATNIPYNITNWTIEFILDDDNETLYNYTNDGITINYCKYIYNTAEDILKDRYIMVHIDEENNINQYSTSDLIKNSFAVLYRYSSNEKTIYFDSRDIIKKYDWTNLKNLDSLTLTFRNSCGKIFTTDNLNFDITTPNICVCSNDKNLQCLCNYIRHPYYKFIQNNVLLKVGILKTNISKKVFC